MPPRSMPVPRPLRIPPVARPLVAAAHCPRLVGIAKTLKIMLDKLYCMPYSVRRTVDDAQYDPRTQCL
jgi:hypothetical protein